MNQVFNSYAHYYDLLYFDKDYNAEAKYVSTYFEKYITKGKKILELGCGTGAHAEYFARLGYTVHGVDMSQEMLDRAEKRKLSLPADVADRLSFSLGDVRSVNIEEKYDIVISLFHVISYQSSNNDLVSSFKTANKHLNPDGVFLFDFWYGPAVLTQTPEVRVKRLEDEEIKVTRIAEPIMNMNKNLVDVNYTIYIDNKNTGEIEQLTEKHRMRYLFLPELSIYLSNADLQILECCKWMGDQEPDENTWAGFIIARK